METHPSHPSQLGPRSFSLTTARIRIGAAEFAAEPRLWALAAEDIAWSVAVEDWWSRKPAWWHHARRARWAREGDQHRATALRLQSLARQYGLGPDRPGR